MRLRPFDISSRKHFSGKATWGGDFSEQEGGSQANAYGLVTTTVIATATANITAPTVTTAVTLMIAVVYSTVNQGFAA